MREDIDAYYQDWSTNTREEHAWRMAKLQVDRDTVGFAPNEIELYLVRPDAKKNTFYIQLDRREAARLRDQLTELLGG